MNVNLRQLIIFYDEGNKNISKHVSSVTGIVGEDIMTALFTHCLARYGAKARVLSGTPTEGKRTGKWLDRWVLSENVSSKTFWQMEIKNWSSHGYGSKGGLAHDCSDEDLKENAVTTYEKITETLPNDLSLGKVLRKMAIEREPWYKEMFNEHCKRETVLGIWTPVQAPELTEKTPLFSIDIDNDDFGKLYIFSGSVYARLLIEEGIDSIELILPNTEKRIEILNTLFS